MRFAVNEQVWTGSAGHDIADGDSSPVWRLCTPINKVHETPTPMARRAGNFGAKSLFPIIEACDRRRVFITDKGFFGLGPAAMAAGDTCWVLCGSKVPSILRPNDDDEMYQFVGEAYMRGLMRGEAANLSGSESLEVKHVRIY